MRNKVIAGIVLALAVPSLALAAKPNPPGKSTAPHGKAAPKVMYVLKGTLSNYTAATSTTPGSVTLLVNHSNRHGAALKTMSVVFTIDYAKTKVKIGQKRTTITDGDKGVVKLRAPKKMDQATFSAFFQPVSPNPAPTALMVIDQKVAPTS